MITFLANLDAIYRKELQGYFKSPLAGAIAGLFWLVTGLFLIQITQIIVGQAAAADLGQSPTPVGDVATTILQGFLSTMGSILLFVLPLLSMNLYAEERKRGTLELLATSPIANWVVALGKLLAVITFVITLLLPMALLEVFIYTQAKPPLPPQVFLVGHLAVILLAAALLSLGMFISSLSDSAIFAAFFTFVLGLILWILGFLGQSIGGVVGTVLNHLSLLSHYTTLTQGVLDSPSIIVFASYIVLGLFLTAQSTDLLRFQQS